MERLTKQSGFTLIELLVYVGILVVVSTASVGFLISLDDVIEQYQLETTLYRSSSNALEQIQVALRRADTFETVGSVLNDGATGALTVAIDGDTTQFVRTGTTLELFIEGESYGSVVDEGVVVDSFTVYRYPTAVGDMMRVELVLSAATDGASKSVTLYTGAVIRGGV